MEVPKEADRTVLQIKTKSGCDVLIEYSKCWVVKKKIILSKFEFDSQKKLYGISK